MTVSLLPNDKITLKRIIPSSFLVVFAITNPACSPNDTSPPQPQPSSPLPRNSPTAKTHENQNAGESMTPDLAESLIRKFSPDYRGPKKITCDAAKLKALIGQTREEMLTAHSMGEVAHTLPFASGDVVILFAGPFTSSIGAVAVKLRNEKVSSVNVTVHTTEQGLEVKGDLLDSCAGNGIFMVKFAGDDGKGMEAPYGNFVKTGTALHTLVHESKELINLIIVDTNLIPLAEGASSMDDPLMHQ